MLFAIIITVFAVAAVVVTARSLPRRWRQPRVPDWVVSSWLEPDEWARAVPTVMVLGTTLLTVIAVIGWTEVGERDGAAEWARWVVVVLTFSTLIVPIVVGKTGRPRFAVPRTLRGDLRDTALHDATIHHLAAGDEFIAICDCGWVGDTRASEWEARLEAQRHTTRVREEVAPVE